MRLAAAEPDAYLADDLRLCNARHAKAMTARLQPVLKPFPGTRVAGMPVVCRLSAVATGESRPQRARTQRSASDRRPEVACVEPVR
jgi:threonine aldolase